MSQAIGVYEEDHSLSEDRKYELDSKLWVTFYRRPIFNKIKSDEAGRRIYDEADYVKIVTPGNRDTFETEVTFHYQQRFPRQWEQYKNQQTQSQSGTPVEMVPWLSVSQVAELKAMNLHTLEQIVIAPDTVSQKFMAFQQLRRKAEAFLDSSAHEAEKTKLEGELVKRDELIANMSQRLSLLEADAAAKTKGK